jgi:hypothetical protein
MRTKELSGSVIEEGRILPADREIIQITQEVTPQDNSPPLPLGMYEVEDIHWITWSVNIEASHPNWPLNETIPSVDETPREGIATFYVVSGRHAGKKRRIGKIRTTLNHSSRQH